MNKYSDIELRALTSKFLPPILSPKPKSLLPQDFEGLIYPVTSFSPLYDSTRISDFTKRENEKVHIASDSLLYNPNNQRVKSQIFPTQKSQDFLALLKSIDFITNNKEVTNLKSLVEGEILTIILEQGSYHSFKINCKEKRSPLKVNIRRKFGKIRSFVSKSVEKPNIEKHDYINYLDCYEFGENSIKFLYESVYLGIEAISDTEFSIGITFGKLKSIYIPTELPARPKNTANEEYEELRKNEEMRVKLKNKVDKLLKERKQQYLKLSGSKNFLKINKNISRSNSDKQITPWECKKEQVFKRKQEIYTEKKENAIKSLNKKVIQSQQELIQREENEKRSKIMTFQRYWIKLSSLIQSTIYLKRLLTNQRDLFFKGLQEKSAARIIQKRLKSNFYIKDRFLLHIRNNLLFLWQATYPYHADLTSKVVLKSIEFSAVNNHVAFSFNLFIKKVKSIQKASKYFMGRNKTRIEEVTKLWNNMISKLVSKSSVVAASRYLKITSHMRNEIIKKYYSTKLIEFMDKVKTADQEIRRNSSLIPRSIVEKSPEIRKPALSEFKYIPAETELREMIENAAESYKVI